MRTAPKHKNNKHSPKKEFIVHNRETGMTDIAEAAGTVSGKIPAHSAATNSALAGVSSEERHQLISQAAYFRAEQRSFAPGNELEDWLTAEAEIEMRLSSLGTEDLPRHS
jgi:hypothetical protein